MSVEQALAFLEHLGTRESVRRRIGALRGSGALAELSEIGREEGFVFSEGEYRQAVNIIADNALSAEAIDRFARENRLTPDNLIPHPDSSQ